jgi:tetratricopeptide (TPR) repeat protein
MEFGLDVPDDADIQNAASLTEKPGDKIGRYTLRNKIGEGGFGVVWMAEQEEPVRRRVALKIIKLGMDTKEVVARFEAERQALAMMDHPSIAKVFDGGATGTGRPYFVMELVCGLPITKYCDEARLSTPARLALFGQVCQAVQHAHHKGIIHRDLKPSNILVTELDGRAVPKVIDFGVAKATELRLTEKTLFTRFGQRVGTPAYMSPEQAGLGMLDIDARTDIYSLGVVLYELLAGRPPFEADDLSAIGYEAIFKVIREVEPPRPSTRLSTLSEGELKLVAGQRRAEPRQLNRLIRGELDWIVMKALEKDRARRYESASALAQDIQNHLRQEPVAAAAPSASYQFRKFARRNKVALAIVGAFAALVVTGILVSTGEAIRARQAEGKWKTEAKRSRHTAQFLIEMLNGVGPSVALGRDTKLLREILERTAIRVSQDLGEEPMVAAEIRSTIGNVYRDLGEYQKAAAMHREALAAWRGLLGNEHTNVADSLNNLASALVGQDKLAEAEILCHQALALNRKLLGEEHREVARSLNNLAVVLWSQGKSAEAEPLFRQALAMRRKLFANQHEDVAASLLNLANAVCDQARPAEAEALYREALAMQKKLLGNDHPDVANSLHNLADALSEQSKLAEAESTQREALAMYERLLGPDHPYVANALHNLAALLSEVGKLDEAEALYRRALAMRRKLLGAENLDVAGSLGNLASLLSGRGRFAEAESLSREALAMRKRLLGNEDRQVAASLNGLGNVLFAQGKLAEAEDLYREALAMRKKLLDKEDPDVAESLNNLANVLVMKGLPAEAEPLYRDALAMKRKCFGDQHKEVAAALDNMASVFSEQGRFAEAEIVQREALAMWRKLVGDEHPEVATSLGNLASIIGNENRLAEAETMQRHALAMCRKLSGDEHPYAAVALHNLASVLWDQGRLAEAETMQREALAMHRRLLREEHPDLAAALNNLAGMLSEQGKLAEAETTFHQALAMRRQLLGTKHPEVAVSLADLAHALLKGEKFAQGELAARECLAIREEKLPDAWRTFEARSLLGASLLGQRDYAQAEPLLLSGYEGMKQREEKIPAHDKPRLVEAARLLARLYEDTSQPDKATQWKQKLEQHGQPDPETKPAGEPKSK